MALGFEEHPWPRALPREDSAELCESPVFSAARGSSVVLQEGCRYAPLHTLHNRKVKSTAKCGLPSMIHELSD